MKLILLLALISGLILCVGCATLSLTASLLPAPHEAPGTVTEAPLVSTATPAPAPTVTATALPPAARTLAPTATPSATPTPTASPATATPVPADSLDYSAAPVPVLMYHYIRVNPNPADQVGAGLSVTPRDFEAQMAYMAQQGYRTISLADLGSPKAHMGKVFIPTFDDGYVDAYTAAAPILKRYGFTGVFYIITDFVETHDAHMTWAHIKALAADGMTIGSHTASHPDLAVLGAARLRHELVESKAALEAQIGQPVVDLCYPSGRYNGAVEAAARQAGYLTAVTTRGAQYYPGEDRLALSRVRISGGMGLAEFSRVVSPANRR